MARVQSAVFHKRKYKNLNDWYNYIWNYPLKRRGWESK